MNPAATKARQAFTLIELLVMVAIVAILLAMYLPTRSRGDRLPARQGQCMSNLRQVGLGLLMYAQDNKDMFPWQVSTNQGGTAELAQDGNAADHFARLASYFSGPRVFLCPTDMERQVGATNYLGFSNTNLSYFAAPNTSLSLTSSPAIMILSGDRHLAFNNQPVKPGPFSITNNSAMSWTKELHFTKGTKQTIGVLLCADGHTTRTSTKELPTFLNQQPLVATRLQIP